jgi:hypothetical protein
MCSEISGGSSRRKSRLRSGAIVVEMKSNSEGVQSLRREARYWGRSDEGMFANSRRDSWAGSYEKCCVNESGRLGYDERLGPGEGAGVGGEATGMYSIWVELVLLVLDMVDVNESLRSVPTSGASWDPPRTSRLLKCRRLMMTRYRDCECFTETDCNPEASTAAAVADGHSKANSSQLRPWTWFERPRSLGAASLPVIESALDPSARRYEFLRVSSVLSSEHNRV